MKRRRPPGRRWTVLGMAFGAVARAGEPFAERLWDDPAFALYQEAAEAMDRRDYARAAALARSAVAHYPDFVLAHYLLGQVALADGAVGRGGGRIPPRARAIPGLAGRP